MAKLDMRDFSDQVTWVLVADGEKALVFFNNDSDMSPDLRTLDATEIENPPSRNLGAARPGRANAGQAGNPRRSSFEETDFHQLAEDGFAQGIIARLNSLARDNAFDRLIVFAPAKTLGKMRAHYSAELRKKIATEADKDLTNHSLDQIEKHFRAALSAI